MTAEDALRNPPLRRRIVDAARTSDPTVKAWLRGVPAESIALDGAIRVAAAAQGIDLSTRPVLTPEAIAAARAKRRGDTVPRVARLVEEHAALRARIATLEGALADAHARSYPAGTVAAVDAEDARARAVVAGFVAGGEVTPRAPSLVGERPHSTPRMRVYLPGSDVQAGTLAEVAQLPVIVPPEPDAAAG